MLEVLRTGKHWEQIVQDVTGMRIVSRGGFRTAGMKARYTELMALPDFLERRLLCSQVPVGIVTIADQDKALDRLRWEPEYADEVLEGADAERRYAAEGG